MGCPERSELGRDKAGTREHGRERPWREMSVELVLHDKGGDRVRCPCPGVCVRLCLVTCPVVTRVLYCARVAPYHFLYALVYVLG